MKRVSLLVAALLLAGPAVAEDPPTLAVKRLSLEYALRIAQGAVEACRKEGIQIGVTVVDRNGTVQAVLRDTLAPVITLEISRMKAFTAANFMADTSALSERADTPIGRSPGLVMSAGGVVIDAGGIFLGGVGVSGAPSGETDEMCARAGVDRVRDDLELGM